MDAVHASTLPGSVAWLAERFGLVGDDGHVGLATLRGLTVGQMIDAPFASTHQLSAFVSDLAAVIGGGGGASGPAASGGGRSRRPRTRTRPTKAEQRSEMTVHIADYLTQRPGSTVSEIARALGEPVNEVAVASRPVDWLILDDDELQAPTERVESEAIRATRERARAAMSAASLLVSPLSHQAYTNLVREGRIKGPSVARIVQLFGSWTAACGEVGVASGEPLRKNYERNWTKDDLLGYVERFLVEPEFRGASHQYDKWRASLLQTEKVPSLGTVRNIVGGTWNDIRAAALRRMRTRWSADVPRAVNA